MLAEWGEGGHILTSRELQHSPALSQLTSSNEYLQSHREIKSTVQLGETFVKAT